MPTTAEILLRARDQFSKATDDAKRQINELGRQTKASMAQAKDSADLLTGALGIQLPRELTKLAAQSKTLGPILAASFSATAVFGFIAAAGQLAPLFRNLEAAITGWDERAKKAFSDQLLGVQKYRDGLREAAQLQTELMVRAGILTGTGGAERNIDRLKGDIGPLTGQLDAMKKEQANRSRFAAFLSRTGEAPVGSEFERAAAFAGLNDEQLATRIEATTTELKALNDEMAKLQNTLARTDQAEAAEWFAGIQKALEETRKKAEATRKSIAGIVERNRAGLSQQLLDGGMTADLSRLSGAYVSSLEGRSSALAARETAMGLDRVRPQMWAGSFNPDVFDPAAADARAMLTRQSVLQQAQEQFFRDFRDAAGHAWDVFATRGKAALALLSTIGRNMFQSFATGLFTGAKGGGGGILGAAGNIGSSLGVSTGLAGLFTGGAAAGSVVPLAAVQAGWVPSLPIVGATGGGIGGALGLSGGAGLLGLGAATIPVIGGAILGGFLLGKALFGRKTLEAPFTMDPNSIERNRSVFFFTGMTDALDRLNRTLGRFDTMQPGPLVMEGLPVALGSSNQWRRNVSSVLLDDEL